jgi:ATP-dependent Clp endopeptidase proteolytic subunit ClpP
MSLENINPEKAFNKDEVAHLEQYYKMKKLQSDAREQELRLKKLERDERLAGRQENEADFKTREAQARAEMAEMQRDQLKRSEENAKAESSEHLIYTFYAGVDELSVKPAMETIGKWARRFPKENITVVLNSPGGSVLDGLALYDFLRHLSAKGHFITVKVYGMAASMGGILLQAGDKRIVGPEAEVLIHEVASMTMGKVSIQQDRLDFSKKLWDKLAKILAKRSTMTATQIKRKAHKFDWWLTAKEAVRLGFADEVEKG